MTAATSTPVATASFAAKRELADRLTALAGPGGPLAGVQVSYGYPAAAERELVYVGRVRFVRDPQTAEHPVVYAEQSTVDVVIRVATRGNDARAADARAEALAAAVADGIADETRFTHSWLDITGGRADLSGTDDEQISTVTLQVVLIAAL